MEHFCLKKYTLLACFGVLRQVSSWARLSDVGKQDVSCGSSKDKEFEIWGLTMKSWPTWLIKPMIPRLLWRKYSLHRDMSAYLLSLRVSLRVAEGWGFSGKDSTNQWLDQTCSGDSFFEVTFKVHRWSPRTTGLVYCRESQFSLWATAI